MFCYFVLAIKKIIVWMMEENGYKKKKGASAREKKERHSAHCITAIGMKKQTNVLMKKFKMHLRANHPADLGMPIALNVSVYRSSLSGRPLPKRAWLHNHPDAWIADLFISTNSLNSAVLPFGEPSRFSEVPRL